MIIMPHNRPGHNSSSQARQTSGTPQTLRLPPGHSLLPEVLARLRDLPVPA
jgi:hypothetical protein